jgi:hypothetical protein
VHAHKEALFFFFLFHSLPLFTSQSLFAPSEVAFFFLCGLDGPTCLQVAMSLNNAAAVQWQAGRLEAAIKDTQRALRILEAAYGRDNSFVAMLNMALGKLKNGEPYPIAT